MQTHTSSVTQDIAWFKECLANTELIAALKNIKLIISDVDGTLTDAKIYIDTQGEGGRLFSVQDGFIIKPLQKAGLTIALMSGKDNFSTIQRARKLGIPEELCIVGVDTKPVAVKKLQEKLGLTAEQTLIIGDDFLDAEVKLHNVVKLYVCPSNTIFYLQHVADLVIPRHGGDHAFRLFMDLILYIHNKHFAQALIEKALN